MRKFTNAALLAVLVAAGFVSFSTSVEAQGFPGGGRAKEVLCRNLEAAEDNAEALPDEYEFKADLLATIQAQQDALGCADPDDAQ